MQSLTQDPIGKVLICIALVMLAAGALTMRKIVNVRV